MAKPVNWEELSQDEKIEIATEFLNSERGKCLLAYFLLHAVEAFVVEKKGVPELHHTNIEGTQILLDIMRILAEHSPVFSDFAELEGLVRLGLVRVVSKEPVRIM